MNDHKTAAAAEAQKQQQQTFFVCIIACVCVCVCVYVRPNLYPPIDGSSLNYTSLIQFNCIQLFTPPNESITRAAEADTHHRRDVT